MCHCLKFENVEISSNGKDRCDKYSVLQFELFMIYQLPYILNSWAC